MLGLLLRWDPLFDYSTTKSYDLKLSLWRLSSAVSLLAPWNWSLYSPTGEITPWDFFNHVRSLQAAKNHPTSMHLVSFAAVFRVMMRQALCDNPNNGCEGDYHAFWWRKQNSWRISLVLEKLWGWIKWLQWDIKSHATFKHALIGIMMRLLIWRWDLDRG